MDIFRNLRQMSGIRDDFRGVWEQDMRQFWRLFTVLLTSSMLSPYAWSDDGWGGIKGRFVWEGPLPAPEKLVIERDAEICGDKGLLDESLKVHPENRGVANVVLWLDSRNPLPIHPESQQPGGPVRLDNRGCRFEPRVAVVRTGGVLELVNSDPVAHNAAVYLKRSTPFNDVIPQGKPLERILRKAEQLPARVDCSIHPWMKAWLLVLDHPYAVVSNSDGRFELPRLPAGEWTFRVWQERAGLLKQLQRGGVPETLDKGQLRVVIPAGGEVSLGELGLSSELFRK